MTEHAPKDPQEDPSLPPAEPESRPALGDTIGTGTSIALGCIAATLLLIVLGILFIVIATVLN